MKYALRFCLLALLTLLTLAASSLIMDGRSAHWHVYYKEFKDHVLESDVVIAQGVYEKGLYVKKERQKSFRIQSRDDLSSLSAVTDKALAGWRQLN